MKTLFRLLVLVLLLAGWGLAAMAVHVVRTPDRVLIVPKNTLGIGETYVDTRLWTSDDLVAHPLLIQRLVAADKTNVLKHVANSDDPFVIKSMCSDALARVSKIDHAHAQAAARMEKGTTKPQAEAATGKSAIDQYWSQLFK